MLTCYKAKDKRDPYMSLLYPHVIVKDDYLGLDRITCLPWTGSNPALPYNPRHLPIPTNLAVTMRAASKGMFWFAASFSIPDNNHNPDWPF